MFRSLFALLDSIKARDPAARSRLEVLLCYPSVHVLLLHRASHWLWRRRLRLLARWLSQMARWLTGIEIHPAAQIGKRLFIDHGMGVVIGEFTKIGDDVTLYHGVTLGGVSPSENSGAQRQTKRHPTLEDRVIVGSGAQLLGPIRIAQDARVGANAVVTQDVAAATTVVGIPARAVQQEKRRPDRAPFKAYGLPSGGQLDELVERETEALRRQITALEARIARLEAEQKSEAT